MEHFSSPDFWLDQLTAAFIAWAIVIPLISGFFGPYSKLNSQELKNEMHRLQADTEAIESRLQLAREINAGEANILANLQAEIEGLRQVIQTKRARVQSKPQEGNIDNRPALEKHSKGKPSIAEAVLKEVDASAATLAMANRTTDHILTSETLAIGDLEKKQKLRLPPRPSSGPIRRNR